jgi:hydroxyacylglutathione hydrolase
LDQISVEQLKERVEAESDALVVVDVRESSEWREGHIPGAIHMPFHELRGRASELPGNKTLATICGSGNRSSIAASILQARGLRAINVAGGLDAWRALDGALKYS